MTITLSDLNFLTSERGRQALAQLATVDLSEQRTLSLITALREDYTRDEASAALTMARLRQAAETKFGADAHRMLFTDDGLQQASDPHIRQYRAREAAGWRVLDVGCGIGADSIAFARAGAQVTGIDIDEVRIAIARHNARACGLEIAFRVADARTVGTSGYDLIFYDPARRDDAGNRIYHVEHYQPPLSLIERWETAARIMAKIAPGVDEDQLAPYLGGVEFISVEGDLKEALLHIRGQIQGMQATLIANDDVHHWRRAGLMPDVLITEPQQWLVEPDAALLRANLVQDAAAHFDGTMLDAMIAYFTTPHEPQSPWVRAWRIREWLPFHLKKLRARLREHDIGTLTVKKRGSPIAPADLIRKLKLNGAESATVVLTRYRDMPIAIICDDIAVS